VVRRKPPRLATLLAQHEPRIRGFVIEVAHTHLHNGTDAREREQHHREQRLVAQAHLLLAHRIFAACHWVKSGRGFVQTRFAEPLGAARSAGAAVLSRFRESLLLMFGNRQEIRTAITRQLDRQRAEMTELGRAN
jgi:hypothetical protein